MHANDKLKEAAYFLGLLRGTTDRAQFRYLMSAFLAAARSVTFSLQSDLRHVGVAFDEWYSEVQQRLRDHPMGPTINRVRTVFQKEGNKLYCRTTFQAPDGSGPILRLDYSLSRVPVTFREVDSITIEFRENRPEVRASDDIEKAIMDWHSKNIDAIIHNLSQNTPGEWEIALTPDAPRVPPRILLDELSSFVDLLGQVVAEASERFSQQQSADA